MDIVNENVFIASHQARLRCLTNKLFNASNQRSNDDLHNLMKENRWQNCCVIQLQLTPINSSLANICTFTVIKKGGLLRTSLQQRKLAIDISKGKIYNINLANNNIQWEYTINSAVSDVTFVRDTELSFNVKTRAKQDVKFLTEADRDKFIKLMNIFLKDPIDIPATVSTESTTCSVEPQYEFELSLLYSGEIDPAEEHARGYWMTEPSLQSTDKNYSKVPDTDYWMVEQPTSIIPLQPNESPQPPPDKNQYYIFNPIKGNIALRELRDTFSISEVELSQKQLTFYLVRHGQAEHNTKMSINKTINRTLDTSLTEIGKQMAKRAGTAINAHFKGKTPLDKFHHLYVSDLTRTHDTLLGIVMNIDLHYLPLLAEGNSMKITVLPCAHELKFTKDGRCDLNMDKPFLGKFFSNLTKENIMNCDVPSDTDVRPCSSLEYTHEGKIISIQIDWENYTKFYENSNRTKRSDITFCKGTSMIEQCIKHINELKPNNQYAIAGGMKRYRSNRKINRKINRKTNRKITKKTHIKPRHTKIYKYSKRRHF